MPVPVSRPAAWPPPVRRPPLFKHEVADFVRTQIFSGVLRASERIDQDELAAQLGVSRVPVREALIVLEWEGLVRSIPHRGTFIAAISPDDVRDIYEIYAAVAASSAERALPHLGGEAIRALKELAEQARQSSGAEQIDLIVRLYRTVYRAGVSGWRRADLRRLGRSLPPWLMAPEAHSIPDTDRAAGIDRLIQAIESGDADLLRRLVREGVAQSGEQVVRQLRATGFWDRIDPSTDPSTDPPAGSPASA